MNLIDSLSNEISKLPGIGPKGARRIVTYILKSEDGYAESLASLLHELKVRVRKCSVCGMFTESAVCAICSSSARRKDRICVVEESEDVRSLEESKAFDGTYHVLWGRISPYNGMYPEMLNMDSLRKRVEAGGVSEIIVATNPDDEGDVTAAYLKKDLSGLDPNVVFSRISSGLQSGSDISYASARALFSAFENRIRI